MSRRLLLGAAGLALAAGAALAAPANAAGVCVNAHVVVQGQELVNQAQCLPPEGTPAPPALP